MGGVLRYKWKAYCGTTGRCTAVQMGSVLRYSWEAYCGTHWRCIAAFPFLQGSEASKAQRCKWGAYCGTNWRCTAEFFRQAVRVGGSQTVPRRTLGTRELATFRAQRYVWEFFCLCSLVLSKSSSLVGTMPTLNPKDPFVLKTLSRWKS